MMYIDFCKSPQGMWIGCGEHQNGRTFASGRTLDILVKHTKTSAYKIWKMTARNVMLSTRQMEQGEFEAKHGRFMPKKFKTRFWNHKEITETVQKPQEQQKEEVKEKPTKEKHTYEEKNGVLYVYVKKLIRKYELETN